MIVSYGGERIIGNLPFLLFNGQKGRRKGEKEKRERRRRRERELKVKNKIPSSLKKQRRDERKKHAKLEGHEILMNSPPIPTFYPPLPFPLCLKEYASILYYVSSYNSVSYVLLCHR